MVKISIVVPVFNCEKYLTRCLESISSQTFKDFECVLVDDGSSDSSPSICDTYAMRDARFSVIHQRNGGVSAARNAGLESCNGEWIAFVDSDDYVEAAMLTEMYSAIQMNGGGGDDMILCKISDSANSNAYASDYNYSYTDSKYGLCFQSAWGKLYRHSVITSHKLRFPIGCRLGEDTFFTLSYLVHAPNFYYVNKLLYHYFNTNEDSAVNNKSYDSIYSARDAFSDLEKYIKDNNCFERFYKTLFELKLWIKNLFINEIEKPNPKEWRNNFSELNRSLLSYSGDGRKQQVLYNLLVFHIYDFIYPMLKMYKKLKNKGR